MRKEYLLLFNAMTDLLSELQALQLSVTPGCDDPCPVFGRVICRLQNLQLAVIRAQQQAEELYMEGED